jgi:site-specific DNA-cytosine methylase
MKKLKILSICTSAGLLDKAFIEAGHQVVAGCEIMEHKRRIYKKWCGGEFLCHDLGNLPDIVRGEHFDLVIGGPSCQAHSKLKAIRNPKFPDLTPLVNDLLDAVNFGGFVFENVVPINIPDAVKTKLNAMHFPEIWNGRQFHQSRERWFTHSSNITPPTKAVEGDVNSLMAYSVVAGRIYGPKRGAVLQGWPEFSKIDEKCVLLQEALADGVPRGLAVAWIGQVEDCFLNPLAPPKTINAIM